MKVKEHAGFFHGNQTRYPYIVYGLFPLPPPTLYQEKPTHWRLHHLKFHNQTQNIHYLLLSLKHRDTQNVSTTSSFLFKIQYLCSHHL